MMKIDVSGFAISAIAIVVVAKFTEAVGAEDLPIAVNFETYAELLV